MHTNIENLSGKQREIYERDERYLQVARDIFIEEGYHKISIEKIAKKLGFAKGTVYQRFSNKETLMIELALCSRQHLLSSVKAASRLHERPRVRMTAIGEAVKLYAACHPEDIRIMDITENETVVARAPKRQQDRIEQLFLDLFAVLKGVIQDGIDQGDLVLPEDCSVSGIAFSLWAMMEGWSHALLGAVPLDAMGLSDPAGDILRSENLLMDGFNWKPYSSDIFSDYDRIVKAVRQALLESGAITALPEPIQV